MGAGAGRVSVILNYGSPFPWGQWVLGRSRTLVL